MATLDQDYSEKQYLKGLEEAQKLGFKGKSAANFATKKAEQDLQYQETLPEFTYYRTDQDKSNLLGSQVSKKMNEVGNTVGKTGLATTYFTPFWFMEPAVRSGLSLSKGDYKGAAIDAATGLLAPYAIGKGIQYGIKGYNVLKTNRLINNLEKDIKIEPSIMDQAVLAGKIGWGPNQRIYWRHGSDNPHLSRFIPYKERWDVKNRGASPFEFFTTEVSSPKNMMDNRSYIYKGYTDAKKPIIQLGEFKLNNAKNNTRNALVEEARSRGADAYYMQNINDNKAANQNVLINFIDQNGELNSGVSNPAFNFKKYLSSTQSSKTSLAFFERPSKISEAERLGIPKLNRNQTQNNQGISLKKALDNIGISRRNFSFIDKPLNTGFNTKHYNNFTNTPRRNVLFYVDPKKTNNIQDAFNAYSKYEINPIIDDIMIREFKNYYGNLGYNIKNVSDDLLKRVLSAQYDDLIKIQTNKALSGKPLWHSSPIMFDEFKITPQFSMAHGNAGYFMATADSPAYGYGMWSTRGSKLQSYKTYLRELLQKEHPDWFENKSSFGVYHSKPEYVDQINDIINKQLLAKTKELHSIGGEYYSINNQPYLTDFTGNNLLVEADLENMVLPNGKRLQLPWTSYEPSVGAQVGIPLTKKTWIKSLFPHPDLATALGFKSRNMKSSKVNFKQGGKLK